MSLMAPQLLAAVRRCTPAFDVAQSARVAWSLAALNLPAAVPYEVRLAGTVPVGLPPPPPTASTRLDEQQAAAWQASARSPVPPIAMMISGTGKQSVHASDAHSVAKHLAARAHGGLRLCGRSLSNFTWAMARFHYYDEVFLQAAGQRACELAALGRLQSHDVARILWAFAELKHEPKREVRGRQDCRILVS